MSESGRKRSLSRTVSLAADDANGDTKHEGIPVSGAKGRSGAHSISTPHPKDARETVRKTKGTGVVGLIREDISMIIRKRAKAGYGLSLVR